MDSVVIGIDPGSKGAFCLLNPIKQIAVFKNTTDTPIDLYNWIKSVEKQYIIKVIMVENVHAIPGTSAGSNFKFGYNVGVVNTISQVTGNRVDLVNPKAWQKFVGVTKKGKAIKKEVADICQRLYPKVNVRGARGGLLDGLSDSLMIAHYASLKY